MTGILPPLPPAPPSVFLLFSSAQWTWLTQAFAAIYAAQEAGLEAFGAVITSQERLLAMTDDLANAVTRTETATNASVTAINTELGQLRDAVAQLAKVPDTSAIVARLNANADRIEAATAALAADDPAPSAGA